MTAMGFSRPAGFRSIAKQKWLNRVKVAAVVIVIILFITPLRNKVVPDYFWHRSWDDLDSFKLIRIHVFDLFYFIDRSPYTGSCQHVHHHLGPLKALGNPEDLPAYTLEDWETALEKVRWKFSAEDVWKLEHFKPSLSPKEQREMLYSTLVLARAFDIFNITYYMAEGTLIGIYRHHGFVPWDDDVDLMIRADQWAQAREVLSCIPGFSLSMGRDFMWKFMWNQSKLWRGERLIRFPYIDVFPYNEDQSHLWPLTIWMKRDLIWRTEDTHPGQRMPLEGVLVSVPSKPSSTLSLHYGNNVTGQCASRIFRRREREPFPLSERVMVPCSHLFDLYPFVFRQRDPVDGREVQVRKVGDKILSTFKPPAA